MEVCVCVCVCVCTGACIFVVILKLSTFTVSGADSVTTSNHSSSQGRETIAMF